MRDDEAREKSEAEATRESRAVTQTRFRKAMAQWPAGVAVVTADDGAAAHGLTVSSFTSVSLTPPQCLVCVNHASPLLPILRRADRFAAHLLTETQAELAMVFAGSDAAARTRALQRRAAEPPRLARFLIRFEMRLAAEWPAGDHAVLLGEATAIERGAAAAPLDRSGPVDDSEPADARPLTWWRSALGSLAPRARSPEG
ncbi:MAG: flavin reductase family protein [Pseudomonadota bacterium]